MTATTEESKATTSAESADPSDYLVATGAGDETQTGRRYKVVASALDF